MESQGHFNSLQYTFGFMIRHFDLAPRAGPDHDSREPGALYDVSMGVARRLHVTGERAAGKGYCGRTRCFYVGPSCSVYTSSDFLTAGCRR